MKPAVPHLATLALLLGAALVVGCGARQEPTPGPAAARELQATAAALAEEVLRLRHENARLEQRIATITQPPIPAESCPQVVEDFYLTFVSGILYEVEQVSPAEQQRLTQVIVFFESFCRLPDVSTVGGAAATP